MNELYRGSIASQRLRLIYAHANICEGKLRQYLRKFRQKSLTTNLNIMHTYVFLNERKTNVENMLW